MYSGRVRTTIIRLTVATVALAIAVPGVASAQTGTDVLGAQSAGPVQTNGAPDQGDIEGEFGSGGGNPTGDTEPTADNPGSGAALPSTDSGPETKASGAAGSQAASLPFTGFMAIPVLLAGLMLLGSGLVIRSRTSA